MDFLSHLFEAPLPNVLIIAGVIFLGIAAVGKVVGKIEPDKTGRILSGVLGLALLVTGFITLKSKTDQPPLPTPTGFVSVVKRTNPIAYFRLESTSGKSEVGDAVYTSSNTVNIATPGAPIGTPRNHCAILNGANGEITTTLVGEVGSAGSLMIWVNLASLPSALSRPFYLVGESQFRNDFDLQFEADNSLRFYTERGGSIAFHPDPASLVNQWHLAIATFDIRAQRRSLYWDGGLVQADSGGSTPNKTGVLSIGESAVWRGRFFSGSLDEVSVWNRALDGSEVQAIYNSASKSGTEPK